MTLKTDIVKPNDKSFQIPYVPEQSGLTKIPRPVIKQTVHKNYLMGHYHDIDPNWPRKDVLLP